MFRHLIALLCVLQMALAAPQFVTFKDGKVGVNFGGYHAEAGLGGLLTGNAAHGGLSASAGTPWGPKAAAGLNGALDGRAAGTAYAGAQLNPQVGASSIIGGSVGEGHSGFSGAEAHSNGKTVVKTHGIVSGDVGGDAGATEGPEPEHGVQKVHFKSVQKIKPHKKYHLIKTEETKTGATAAHSKQVVKSVYKEIRLPSGSTLVSQDNLATSPQHSLHSHPYPHHQSASSGVGYENETVGIRANTGLVGNVLNIPIGILRSLQESLSGIDVNKSVSYTKLA